MSIILVHSYNVPCDYRDFIGKEAGGDHTKTRGVNWGSCIGTIVVTNMGVWLIHVCHSLVPHEPTSAQSPVYHFNFMRDFCHFPPQPMMCGSNSIQLITVSWPPWSPRVQRSEAQFQQEPTNLSRAVFEIMIHSCLLQMPLPCGGTPSVGLLLSSWGVQKLHPAAISTIDMSDATQCPRSYQSWAGLLCVSYSPDLP